MLTKTPEPADTGGIRQIINKHPLVASGVIIVIVVGLIAWQFWPQAEPGDYFTTDDGATTFRASGKIPPFEKDSKQAVRAKMYSCDGGKTLFVGYLLRFTEEGKKKLEADMAAKRVGLIGGFEVKKPGDKEWVGDVDWSRPMGPGGMSELQRKDKKFKEVQAVKCPDGKPAQPYNPPE